MKKPFIFLFTLILSAPAWGQHTIEKSPIVISIAEKVITNCLHPDSICYILPIKRNNKNQPVIVLFPLGGTQSDISLFPDRDFYKYKRDVSLLDDIIRVHDRKMFGEGQLLTLNLTGLEDGNYIVLYSSCAFGGLVKIPLVTE